MSGYEYATPPCTAGACPALFNIPRGGRRAEYPLRVIAHDVRSFPPGQVLAIGEGWHNWHHKYPFDYAASELGVSSQFNPTKLVIDLAAALGMVSDRKRATAMWAREKAKRGAEAKAKEQ